MTSDETPGRSELAEDRTDLAEDRTLLANERTFSGWARTAMASIGIGIGFNALFQPVEPTWVAKAIATVFILLGIFLIVAAERRACVVQGRLTAHKVSSVPVANFRIMAVGVSGGAIALIGAIWWLA
ncbi:YidH family protein [Sphingomonas sp.]|jgi:putative membrane protein|uniref:YidH family protein n=1 Tax=Sphingomonas sp. TaxID=28214 RepID=UPI0035C82356